MSFEQQFNEDRRLIETALENYTQYDGTIAQAKVLEAMRYSLLGGGKRIRAVLAIEFCRALKGDISAAMPAACALEMVHAYSLIHDDLPCMDDDDMRRGKPSNHIRFGEAVALLAGDGLLTLAFETLSRPDTVALIGAQRAVASMGVLSSASGEYGMLGGQVVDVLSEGKVLTLMQHADMVRMKTGALIEAAVHCGCIAANTGKETIALALQYAQKIGLAFQITDDLLDVTGDSTTLGKPVGSDEKADKVTYVSLLGLAAAQEKAQLLFSEAQQLLGEICPENAFLPALNEMLARRRS